MIDINQDMTAREAIRLANQCRGGATTEDLREAWHTLKSDHPSYATLIMGELCKRAVDREIHKLSFEP